MRKRNRSKSVSGNGNGDISINTGQTETENTNHRYRGVEAADILDELRDVGVIQPMQLDNAAKIVQLRRSLLATPMLSRIEVHMNGDNPRFAKRTFAKGAPDVTAATPVRKAKRHITLTPEQLKSRQLQGRYLGLIRQMKTRQKAHAQKIMREEGREKAVAWMEKQVG